MNTPENDDIHKLLRLKKHEQPPPEYFENFLAEFQRRQREEMLKRSVWEIAWDRVQAFFETDRAGAFRYATATAMMLVATGVIAMKIVSPQGTAPTAQNAVVIKQLAAVPAAHTHSFTLDMRPAQPDATTQYFTSQPNSGNGAPYYVMDARPVSYEAPSGL